MPLSSGQPARRGAGAGFSAAFECPVGVQVLPRIDDTTPNLVAITDAPTIVVAPADAWSRGAAVPLRVEADPDGGPLRVVSVTLDDDVGILRFKLNRG